MLAPQAGRRSPRKISVLFPPPGCCPAIFPLSTSTNTMSLPNQLLTRSQSEHPSRSRQSRGRRPRSPGGRNASQGAGGRGGGASAAGTPASGRCSPTASQDSQGSADSVFREAMRRKGLSVVDVEPDGNCLFRSVSHQIFGDAERHHQVRGG